jgi:uncharacterized membrane protein YdbT with pleckstrin-like domain
MEQLEPDEQLVVEVTRHPIGILFFYIQAGLGVAVAIALAAFIGPSLNDTFPDADKVLAVGVVFLALIMGLILLVATSVYRASKLIVTNKHVIQVLQRGVFDRKVSQLSLMRVENVTSEEPGFFASIFNYGTIRIETAGEQDNFYFSMARSPNWNAKRIAEVWQAARENRHDYDPAKPEVADNAPDQLPEKATQTKQ